MFDSEEFINETMEWGLDQICATVAGKTAKAEEVETILDNILVPSVKKDVRFDELGITVYLSAFGLGRGGFMLVWRDVIDASMPLEVRIETLLRKTFLKMINSMLIKKGKEL